MTFKSAIVPSRPRLLWSRQETIMCSQSRLFSVPASFLAEICFSIATKERKCSKSGYLQKSISVYTRAFVYRSVRGKRIRNMGHETKRARERDTHEGRDSFLSVSPCARAFSSLAASFYLHRKFLTSLAEKQQIVTYFYLYKQRTSLLIAQIRMPGAAPRRKHVSTTA